MYTRNIILEEVGMAEFEQMKHYWGRGGLNIENNFVVSKIEEPLIWPLVSGNKVDDYIDFIHFLLDHQYLSQIAVNNKRWEKYPAGEVRYREQTLEKIAAIAAADTRKIHYFEAKFSTPEGFEKTRHRAMIEFVELRFGENDCRIVGFQTVVPFIYRHWFTSALEPREYHINHGLWVPKEGTTVKVNATR